MLRHRDFELNGDRQKLEHPHLNHHDNRMTPNPVEAPKLAKEAVRLKLSGGYA